MQEFKTQTEENSSKNSSVLYSYFAICSYSRLNIIFIFFSRKCLKAWLLFKWYFFSRKRFHKSVTPIQVVFAFILHVSQELFFKISTQTLWLQLIYKIYVIFFQNSFSWEIENPLDSFYNLVHKVSYIKYAKHGY